MTSQPMSRIAPRDGELPDFAGELPPTADNIGRNAWDNPNLSLGGITRDSAPAFPVALLGEFWGGWCADRARSVSAPADYVALGLLASAGGALANVRWPSAGPEWSEPPVIWACAVGAPSVGKSPALRSALDLVQAIEDQLAADLDLRTREWETEKVAAEQHRAKWEQAVKKAVDDGRNVPPMPKEAEVPRDVVRPRLKIGDITIESAADKASQNPRGLLLYRDEMAGWIESHNRYNKGGGDRSFWVESYGGGVFPVDRKGNAQPIIIRHLSIGAFGSIQPEKLPSITSGADDGMASRFIFAWPSHSPEFVIAREPIRKDQAAQEAFARFADLVPDLIEDRLEPRRIRLSSSAVDALQEFGVQMKALGGDDTGLFASSIGKARGQALRLACILEHLWWCAKPASPEPIEVSEAATISAIALVADYFLPMAKRVYGDATLGDRERATIFLARQIKRRQLTIFNARDLRREIGGPVRGANLMQTAGDDLVEEGVIRPAFSRSGETHGRPSRNYEVNPLFLGDQ